MTFIDLIRLITRHIRLILGIPILLAILVVFLTKNQPRTYRSSAMIYTGLASGYTIESGEGRGKDYFAVNNAFDNLISTVQARATLEEVGLRLLEQHLMLDVADPRIISEDHRILLHNIITPEYRADLIDTLSGNSIIEQLRREKNSPGSPVYQLFNTPGEPYTIEQLSTVKVARVSNSDMLEFTYESTDPGICYHTVSILIDVFMTKQKLLKTSETGDVVAYFEEQMQQAYQTLREKEQKLRVFKQKNKIINYYEQTKYISAHKKDLDFEFQKEKMAQAAAETAVKKLEEKLGIQGKIHEKSQAILWKRERLSQIASQLTFLEIEVDQNVVPINQLKKEEQTLRALLREDLDAFYQFSHSTEGMPYDQLLSEWLEQFLLVDACRARAEVLLQKQQAYTKELDIFAPLGSTLTRLEREVTVAEQAYMEILHSLNLSKLRQQNIQQFGNLKVLDAPFFPVIPETSKRFLLVLLALIGGSGTCITALILIEYFDNTLKTPARAEEATGLKLAGIMPLICPKQKTVNWDNLLTSLSDQAINHIHSILRTETVTTDTPVILVASTRPGEGKSFTVQQMIKAIVRTGKRVTYLTPDTDIPQTGIEEPSNESSFRKIPYRLASDQYTTTTLNTLIPEELLHDEQGMIFVEINALMQGQMPVGLIEQATLSFIVVQANRSWTDADRYALNAFQQAGGTRLGLIVNGLALHSLETIIGEIDKHRSRFRRFIKRMVQMEFRV